MHENGGDRPGRDVEAQRSDSGRAAPGPETPPAARLREAVRRAAAHAREQMAEIERLRSRLIQQDAALSNLQTTLAETEAERDLARYRTAPSPRGAEDEEPAFQLAETEGSAGRPAPTPAGARRDVTRAATGCLYDSSTGLPLTPILEDRIAQAIRRRQRSPKNLFAVLLVRADLPAAGDNGQATPAAPDASGAEVPARGVDASTPAAEVRVSDLARTALGRRIVAQARQADTVAHLDESGTRYALVLEGIRSLEEAKGVAERLVKELRHPVQGPLGEVRPDVRIGIVFGGPAYDAAAPVLRDAALALDRAAGGLEPVAVFDESAQAREESRRRVVTELGRAIREDQLFLEYQPIVNLGDGRIEGIEVLVRWRHPEHGLVPPDRFIPAAAESPLIHDLGVWLLERACEQARRWQALLGRPVPTLDLNVTGRQLFHERTPDRVREILARHGLDGSRFRFDISEADLMRDPERAAAALGRMRELGCRVAVDDFGTAASSLRALHALPIDAVKIDRAFVSGLEARGTLSVARTVVELARLLEAEAIAEGVETRDQFRFLRSIGCDQAQGYLFSPPVPAGKLLPMLREGYPLAADQPK